MYIFREFQKYINFQKYSYFSGFQKALDVRWCVFGMRLEDHRRKHIIDFDLISFG